jgi:cytochrome c oxidase assembly protein subunit 15
MVWLGLILAQVLLGAATIWSDKAADVATAHVLCGALSLAFGIIVSIISAHDWVLARRVIGTPTAAQPLAGPVLGPLTLVSANRRS